MRKIIFVDNDGNAIDWLKKQLYSMRLVWDMVFAGSGKEALGLMESASYDVVVSDMHMLEMDGVEFFDIVMKKYPGTVRIMHSENSDSEMAKDSVRCTHQFLVKPCSPETIKYTIERTCKLQDLTKNKKVNQTIAGIKNLPSLPKLYDLITKEMQSPDPSLAKVGSLISEDISLSAKILQLVNSAFFSLPWRIIDPKQATIYLGSEAVKAIVLTNHIFSSISDEAETLGFNISQMWNHGLMVGVISGEIARAEQAGKDEIEEAITAGVLHDIGKLILLKTPDTYKEIVSFIDYTGSDFIDAEYAVMKTSHAELGAYLLGLWGIPDSIVEIVAFHHEPSALIENILATMHNPRLKTKDNTTPTGGVLKSRSINKFIKGLTALAAVHTANALITQNNCPPGITTFPGIDMLYLKTVNLEDRLPRWVEVYDKIKN
ncbi:MAG: HDOD domain-containing protein [Candidatus Brocadiaceae bacterium]|nr:HDOD domain-containing protein [Candidatus Brocadiaceae bacterium]